MSVEVGDVFRFYCNFPQTSKEKMMILVKKKPYTFFMINSKSYAVSPYIESCQVDVPRKGHEGFLTHDSVANCVDKVDTSGAIHEKHLVFNDIESHKEGRIESHVIKNIIDSLENKNKTIVTNLKEEIIFALKEVA